MFVFLRVGDRCSLYIYFLLLFVACCLLCDKRACSLCIICCGLFSLNSSSCVLCSLLFVDVVNVACVLCVVCCLLLVVCRVLLVAC